MTAEQEAFVAHYKKGTTDAYQKKLQERNKSLTHQTFKKAFLIDKNGKINLDYL